MTAVKTNCVHTLKCFSQNRYICVNILVFQGSDFHCVTYDLLQLQHLPFLKMVPFKSNFPQILTKPPRDITYVGVNIKDLSAAIINMLFIYRVEHSY